MRVWGVFLLGLLWVGCSRTGPTTPTSTPAPLSTPAAQSQFKSADDAILAVMNQMNAGNFPEAVKLSEAGLKQYPGNYRLLVNQGTCLLQLERYEEGYKSFEEAAKLAPPESKWTILSQQARCAKELGQRAEAEELYAEASKLLEKDPQPQVAFVEQMHRLRAENLARDLRYKESIPFYTKAMEVQDSNIAALIGRALAYSASGNEAGFKADLKKIREASPEAAEEVEKEAARAASTFPQEKVLKEGLQLLRAGQNEDALKRFDKFIQSNPKWAGAYRYKGSALQNLDRFQEAVEAYSKSYSIDQNEASLYNRATCYVGLGELQKAERDLNLFLKISKSPETKEQAKKILELIKEIR